MYDVIGGDQLEQEHSEGFTLGQIIELLELHPLREVRFVGTDYTIGELHCWRGSYDTPALSYEVSPKFKPAQDIVANLQEEIKQIHHGYKGGEYSFHIDQTFYVAQWGCSEEYQVVKAQVENEDLILYTKIVSY